MFGEDKLIEREMVSETFGHSFLAGKMMGSERNSPTRENCPLHTEELSLDKESTTEPTTFPFQPRVFSTLAVPGPGPSVERDFMMDVLIVSPVVNPLPFRVVCFGLPIMQ